MNTDDDQLAAMAALGDRQAYGELVRRHQGLVLSMLARMAGDRTRAEDIAQDAFVRAFEKIAAFANSGTFKSWICRIAYNEFLMSARRQKAGLRTMNAYAMSLDESDGTDNRQSSAAMDVDLDRALAGLTAIERELIVLCYSVGLSHNEAAEAASLPLGTVKTHISQGKRKLKLYFERSAPQQARSDSMKMRVP